MAPLDRPLSGRTVDFRFHSQECDAIDVPLQSSGSRWDAAAPVKIKLTHHRGGPLVVKAPNDARYVQVGTVSFGFSCGLPGFAGLYTRVSKYND